MTEKEMAEIMIDKFYQNSPKEYSSGRALEHGISDALICINELIAYSKDWFEGEPDEYLVNIRKEIENYGKN